MRTSTLHSRGSSEMSARFFGAAANIGSSIRVSGQSNSSIRMASSGSTPPIVPSSVSVDGLSVRNPSPNGKNLQPLDTSAAPKTPVHSAVGNSTSNRLASFIRRTKSTDEHGNVSFKLEEKVELQIPQQDRSAFGAAVADIGRRRPVVDLRRVPGAEVFADKALISYLKIMVEINRSRMLASYRLDPRLLNAKTTEFRVRLGFGLHAGWAIEGAVGSLQKVDATYLSPHVNMAARMETASRQYGVPLLFSQSFFEILSPCAQGYCRKLDVITVKGSELPTAVYTYDVNQNQVFKDVKKKKRNNQSVSGTLNLEEPLTPLDPGYYTPASDTADVFEHDVDIKQLHNHVSEQFLTKFKDGVNSYIQGDWTNARYYLESANTIMMQGNPSFDCDGPSRTLLRHMELFNYRAPSDWRGYRSLTNK